MFNFLYALDNYEDRKVDNTDVGESEIDTCSVPDGIQNYETAVKHPKYNHGKWVIVEAYDTKEDAQDGHNRWVRVMSSISLPQKLVDCRNSYISQLGDEEDFEFEFDGGES